MEAIESKVREIVAGIANIAPDMPADKNLYLDLGVASVHALQLLTELEDHFGISIPDDRFVEATSINDLTALLAGLTQNQAENPARA